MIPHESFSEDIELYIGNVNQRATAKPQVLLIVDTSGSMGDGQTIKTPYNPLISYQTLGSFSGTNEPHLYYVVGTPNTLPSVDDVNENRRFLASINNCSTAVSRLAQVGFYTGRIKEYTFQGNTGSWQEIPDTDGTAISIIDCEDDINLDLTNIANGVEAEHNSNTVDGSAVSGYPIDGEGSAATPVYYNADINNVDSNWGGDVVTIYTDNYLRWDQGSQDSAGNDIGTQNTSRLAIAKSTLANLINSIPSVQFGLAVYNRNNEVESNGIDQSTAHGGRIVFGIQEMTVSARSSLLDIIEDDLTASGWTPLCESYYEAYRYFAGLPVLYGKQDVDGRSPGRDTSIEGSVEEGGVSTDVYQAPYLGCSNEVFVIVITDGVPTRDAAANNAVIALHTNASSTATATDNNYLPALAEYMHSNDINANLPGTQIATLYTVGFSSGAAAATNLLTDAATKGGGKYYDATDPTKLGSSLQKAITSILEVNTTFTAPSVAVNSFDRTETLDSAYYGMFIPGNGARWKGNLKKLKIENGIQVDRDGSTAFDVSGNMLSTAKTYWASSATPDGNDVNAGGVVGMFTNKTAGSRTVYTDTGGTDGLQALSYANLLLASGESGDTAAAAVNFTLGVEDETEANEYLNWALGIDVDDADNDSSIVDYRPDLFGDPLHSKPLALTYAESESSQDIRILVGTNSGVLHMFKDSGTTVDESWAFMPKRFLPKIKTLRDNLPASEKVYGIDGRIVAHVANNKTWIFFGLRRGGSSYYGLDITIPDTPKLLWEIEANTGDFKQLGQTWSQPQVAYSALNVSNTGAPKPVLIFGAGYSIAKDASGPGTADSVGKGIFMVDAEEGTLLWSMTPDATAGVNIQYTGFTDSIPSKISVLDSDGDGLVDRLYVGDTGGNLFRVDMPGSNPRSTTTPWTAFKLAELGGTTNEHDRRFFNAPSIVRTYFTNTFQTTIDSEVVITKNEVPYEAILIGSGDRSTPSGTDTDDKFFMIKDENIITQSFVEGAVAPALDIPASITLSDLVDFTSNPYANLSTPQAIKAQDLIVSASSGWFYNYELAGEKSTAGAFALNGIAYFTSFTPGTVESVNSCSLVNGQGALYAIDLYKGTTTSYNWRKLNSFANMPDTPTITTAGNTGSVTDPSDENAPPGKDQASILIMPGGAVVLDPNVSIPLYRNYQYVREN